MTAVAVAAAQMAAAVAAAVQMVEFVADTGVAAHMEAQLVVVVAAYMEAHPDISVAARMEVRAAVAVAAYMKVRMNVEAARIAVGYHPVRMGVSHRLPQPSCAFQQTVRRMIYSCMDQHKKCLI